MLFTIQQIRMYILKQGEGGLYPVISNLTEENILAANEPFVHLEEDYDEQIMSESDLYEQMERAHEGYERAY